MVGSRLRTLGPPLACLQCEHASLELSHHFWKSSKRLQPPMSCSHAPPLLPALYALSSLPAWYRIHAVEHFDMSTICLSVYLGMHLRLLSLNARASNGDCEVQYPRSLKFFLSHLAPTTLR